MSAVYASVSDRLQKAGKVMKASAVLGGLLWWLAACFGTWLALFALDNLLDLPSGLRFPLALAAAAFTLAVLVRRILAPALRPRRVNRTAVALEQRYGIRDNVLINACQLECREATPAERIFVNRTVWDSLRAMDEIAPPTLWGARNQARWGAGAAVVLAAWIVYSLALPRHAANALIRFAMPLGDTPPVSAVLIRTAPAADVTACEGADVRIEAWLERDAKRLGPTETAPVVVWAEGRRSVPPAREAGEGESMLAVAGAGDSFVYTFHNVRRSFALRVFAAGTYSRSLCVTVRPPPRITAALFHLTPPAYTGLPEVERPGPPAAISGLAGSQLRVSIDLDRPVSALTWQFGGTNQPFTGRKAKWTLDGRLTAAGAYGVIAREPDFGEPVPIARSETTLETDLSPNVDFTTDDRNRYVNPGTALQLDVQASDDYGISRTEITSRSGEADAKPTALKVWSYTGPPGRRGPLTEHASFDIDPRVFAPGVTYLLEALCYDFAPGGVPGRSRPILVRVRSLEDLTVPRGDPMSAAFERLRQTIDEQKKANGLTDTLSVHLDEAVAGKRLPGHRDAITHRQGAAKQNGTAAVAAFRSLADGKVYASRLETLVENEMAWVLADVAKITTDKTEELPARIHGIAARQQHILMELISLLGRIAADRAAGAEKVAARPDAALPPALTAKDAGKQLKDDLEDFKRSQERILAMSRMLMDKGPDDLTKEEEAILGQLAREEADWAKFFEEKLTDFSKLPLQDFGDGSMAKEANEVFQDVKLAAKELYDKNMDMAVPQEQSGLENAKELVNNIERWMPDTPDHTKWSMEEPLKPTDIAMADLPSELEDIVGELLDKEDEMTEDVEDTTSSWMDSIDKAAGWDAADGPISSMSAKGITGNQLPNQMEIGGRSGEGRDGRSHGQMVGDTAEGKDGRNTPTRLTPSPFEPGSVADSSKKSPGGATGGGKLAGYAEQGLRGPSQTPRLNDLARLGASQTKIRQDAEALSLKLRAYNLPSGDLEFSIAAMKKFEASAGQGDGMGVRRAFSSVMDALTDARKAVRTEVGLHHEGSALHTWQRDEILNGLHDGTPKGYEEMIAEYFRALAETASDGGRKPAQSEGQK